MLMTEFLRARLDEQAKWSDLTTDLRLVVAHRQIIDLYDELAEDLNVQGITATKVAYFDGVEKALTIMASGYDWHPDYQKGWAL